MTNTLDEDKAHIWILKDKSMHYLALTLRIHLQRFIIRIHSPHLLESDKIR